MDDQERLQLARARIVRILRRHKIASMRTLENKISDAGPTNQRIDPHVLTNARKELQDQDRITTYPGQTIPWYHLTDTPPDVLERRLAEQQPIHHALQQTDLTRRAGQALEIAVFKTLAAQSTLDFFGHFLDLDDHDDSNLYRKEEPPASLSGRSIPGQRRLDFLVHGPSTGYAGVEVKNIREWLYPDRPEIRDFLSKCCYLDVVPVLIARRIPYVTFKQLMPCGVLIHQNYNQRLPNADAELAAKAKDKNLLGYHDIRLGNEPDGRLTHFVHDLLPDLIAKARERFEEHKGLLQDFSSAEISYAEFSEEVSTLG